MARLNEDGNLFGRISAVAVLAATGVFVSRFCSPSSCPLSAKGDKTFCVGADEQLRDALNDTVADWKKQAKAR